MSKFITASFSWLEYLMSIPAKDRGPDWAYDVCATSRLVHTDVWMEEIEPEIVKKRICRVMKRAVRALRKLRKKPDCNGCDPKALDAYIRNDTLRINNIETNYLKGRPSAFVPAARLNELLAMAG